MIFHSLYNNYGEERQVNRRLIMGRKRILALLLSGVMLLSFNYQEASAEQEASRKIAVFFS